VDGDMRSVVELTVTGTLEQGCDDWRREVVVAGGFATAALDGVNTGSDSSLPGCSRSLAVHVSTAELDSTVHPVTSSDFASGSLMSSSSSRHCFPSSSICYRQREQEAQLLLW